MKATHGNAFFRVRMTKLTAERLVLDGAAYQAQPAAIHLCGLVGTHFVVPYKAMGGFPSGAQIDVWFRLGTHTPAAVRPVDATKFTWWDEGVNPALLHLP